MIDIASSDGSILAAWVVLGGLVLVQAVVADVAGIRSKHTPGMPVTTGHDDFFFRAVRAQANTLENLATFILLSFVAMVLDARPGATLVFVWLFVAARMAHMLAYYADLRLPRSAAFSVGFLALIGLFVLDCVAVTRANAVLRSAAAAWSSLV